MKLSNFAARIVVCVALSFVAMNAQAVPVTYQFGVTATDGPLVGTTSIGTFTFDSSIIPAGGGFVSIAGLFTDLAFSWDGVNFDETTANTADLGFEADGTLIYTLFGTHCGPSGFGCGVGGYPEPYQWQFNIYYGFGAFSYLTPADPMMNIYNGSVTLARSNIRNPGARDGYASRRRACCNRISSAQLT
jgi:hypothetical protein